MAKPSLFAECAQTREFYALERLAGERLIVRYSRLSALPVIRIFPSKTSSDEPEFGSSSSMLKWLDEDADEGVRTN